MCPGTGCVIMATEVNFNDSEPFVVVLVTFVNGWERVKRCMNTKSVSGMSASKKVKVK